MDKNDLPQEIQTVRTLIRRTCPEDYDEFRRWPCYDGICGDMSMTVEAARSKDGRFWWERIDDTDRCHYSVISRGTGEIIGVHALVAINWERRVVGNMVIRIRPDLCEKGYGTESLAALLQSALHSGVASVKLDVVATNQRAVRCYQKCGMRIVEEWWRSGKRPADPDAPEWAPLLRHFRKEPEGWSVRFYWMEITAEHR